MSIQQPGAPELTLDDHGQARGRTEWSSVQVNFTGFPASIVPVVPEPRCTDSGSS